MVLLLAAAAVASVGAVESAFTARASSESSFAAAAVFAPRLVSPPRIDGTPRETQTLTATVGGWARQQGTPRIEWLRCGESCEVVGEGTTRELTADDVGKRMKVRVTATNDGGETTADSEPTATIDPMRPPANVTKPKVTGTATVGETLTATPGEWTGDRVAVVSGWLRCPTMSTCTAIPGETGRTYVVTGDDAGRQIFYLELATNPRGTSFAGSDPTAAVARATYTQILCADPTTGTGVAADGALPDGLRVTGSLAGRFDPRPQTRCAPTSAPQVPLSPGGTYSTTTPDDRIVLEYRTPQHVDFRGATIYRHGTMGGRFSWAVSTSTANHLFAGPGVELCSWGGGCTTRGSTTDRFGTQNRVNVNPGPANGFHVSIACDIAAGSRCDSNGAQFVRLYGGRVTLRDTQTPTVAAKGGTLLDGEIQPTEDLDLTATDAGSGLHRITVTIDGTEVAQRAVHDNGGRCRPDGAFAHQQPCVLSVATSLQLDTTGWPKHGRLRVHLADAGGNTTVVTNRELA